jgi:hypothetical protein
VAGQRTRLPQPARGEDGAALVFRDQLMSGWMRTDWIIPMEVIIGVRGKPSTHLARPFCGCVGDVSTIRSQRILHGSFLESGIRVGIVVNQSSLS